MNFILSPCGTSLLTNEAKGDEKLLVSKNANAKDEKEINPDDMEKLNNQIRHVNSQLEKANKNEAKKLSAELNGIITYYEKNAHFEPSKDLHLLLLTDTYLGEATAVAVKSWLEQNFKTPVEIHKAKRLQTKDYSDFRTALTDLTKNLNEIVDGYKTTHHKVIFNLTGGFKSVQGFLQALGMLWNVDEIIYIFEQSSELIRIPKLPIKVDLSIFEDELNIEIFRRLELCLKVESGQLRRIPEILIETVDNMYDFSAWGFAVWLKIKSEHYGKKIYNPPSKKIEFGDKFLDSCKNLSCDRIAILNKQIDLLAKFAEAKDKITNNPKSLDFKPIKNNASILPSTHEFDAWSDQDAKRVYCHYDSDINVLDRLGKHL